jgi:alkanesulfonate monooxygenase SsuD/methylene tetrahydromethanopterin reductase-like flavin-dependent oxidoreductase (luciferase family)
MNDSSERTVKFGLSLPNRAVLFGVEAASLLETAELAEQSAKFDSVWVGDNLLSKPRLEAIVTLSALAARTQHLKLGSICMASFPMRHPIPFAIQWASLDLLSGGRTILSVCLGGSARSGLAFANELVAMGIESRERVSRLKEGVALLRRFWGPGPVTHHGEHFQFEAVEVLPKPAQARPPIWIAVNPPESAHPATEERALRRVAQLADGWQTDGTPPELFQRRWRKIQEYAQEYGRAAEVTDSCLHLMVNIQEDVAQARHESVEFLNRYYGVGTVSEEKLATWLAAGPPQAVIDKIAAFIEAGCNTPVLRFTAWDQLGQLERCVQEVLPAFEHIGVK